MAKRLFAGLLAIALICSIGAVNVFAAGRAKDKTPGAFGEKHGFFSKKSLTDEEKAQKEAAWAQHKEKCEAFINSLTAEQKALYDAMKPERPEIGQHPKKFDEAAKAAMKEKHEAFIASLTDEQKATFEELMKPKGRGFKGPKS